MEKAGLLHNHFRFNGDKRKCEPDWLAVCVSVTKLLGKTRLNLNETLGGCPVSPTGCLEVGSRSKKFHFDFL